MIKRPFRDLRNGNEYEYKNESREGNDVTKYIFTSPAIIAIVAILISARDIILRTVPLNYTGGASQSNAVIDVCTVGIDE